MQQFNHSLGWVEFIVPCGGKVLPNPNNPPVYGPDKQWTKNVKFSNFRIIVSACPVGYYMDHIEDPGVCTKCDNNTYTLTKASTSNRQCLCVKGYMGPPGGPCAG